MPIAQILMTSSTSGGGSPPPSGTYPATLAATGGSLYFDASLDSRIWITDGDNYDWAPGTGDFTVEWWQWMLADSDVNARVFSVGNWPAAGFGLSLENGTCYLWGEDNNAGLGTNKVGYFGYTVDDILDTWVHIAISRVSGVTRIFFNGVEKWGTSVSYNVTMGTTLSIGNEAVGAAPFSGYLKDFRIIKGVGFYTTEFTPPVQPLTATAETVILFSVNNSTDSLVDSSVKAHTVAQQFGNITYAQVGPYDLALYVDAGNLTSYDSGFPTTWNDLSPSNNHLTLTNNTYSSGVGGYLDFGTNGFAAGPQGIATAQNGITPRASISFWANIYNSGGYQHIAGFRGSEMFHVLNWGGTALECRVDTSVGAGGGGVYDANPSIINQVGNWVHYAFVANGTRSDVYFNGALVSTNDTITGNYDAALGVFGIANINSDYQATNLKMGELRYYNRARSPKEIAREFAATRTRYGV